MSTLDYLIPFVAFVFISSPEAYKLVSGILGRWVANAEGLPTYAGLVLHALVFVLFVGFIMKHSKTSTFYGPKQPGEMCSCGSECYHTCYGGRCN